ncbi:hypothetical protein Tco_0690218 [Tanacetum coccineum]
MNHALLLSGSRKSEGTSTSEHHRNQRRNISITPEIGDDIVRAVRAMNETLKQNRLLREQVETRLQNTDINKDQKLHGWLMDNLRIMMAEEHASKEGTSKEGTSGTADGVRKYQVSKTAANVGDGTDANEFSEGIAAAEEGEKNHSYFVKMDERIRAQCNARWAPCTNGLVSPVDINPINRSADEEGRTTVVGCENKTAPKLQTKRKGVNYVSSDAILWHLKKSTIIAEGTVYKSDGKIMLHNKALPKDCYKVSIDKSLVDAAFIPDVGNNGCTTVLDAVGGFVAWPKNQVVLDPKATPPSTIQMITGENKTAPKVQTKRKNVYVSSDAMQKEAKMRISQKALVY